jgi:hypothetical protein
MTVGKLKALLDGLDEDAVIEYVVMTDYGQNVKYAETEVSYVDAKLSVSSGILDNLSVELIVATETDGIELYKNENQ